jgi:hypothetical protein
MRRARLWLIITFAAALDAALLATVLGLLRHPLH